MGHWSRHTVSDQLLLAFAYYEASRNSYKKYQAQPNFAVLVVDALASSRFEPQLKKGWINWAHPQFAGIDGNWKGIIAGLNKKHPGLP